MRVLVTEDDPVSAVLFELTLRKAGYDVETATTGTQALERLARESFDILLVDWMLPEVDGIEVVRRLCRGKRRPPLIVLATSLAIPQAREHALESGADEFLSKPVKPVDLIDTIGRGLARVSQGAPIPRTGALTTVGSRRPAFDEAPFPAVAIAASTGGPEAVRVLLGGSSLSPEATYLVVIHGPAWMQESLASALGKLTRLAVSVARQGEPVLPGHMYLAVGDRHLVVSPTRTLELLDGPLENYVRPSADPLFRSVSRVFGGSAIGVVLTGVGADAARGSVAILAAQGKVIVQEPEECAAASMPRAVIKETGGGCLVRPLAELGLTIAAAVSARLPARR